MTGGRYSSKHLHHFAKPSAPRDGGVSRGSGNLPSWRFTPRAAVVTVHRKPAVGGAAFVLCQGCLESSPVAVGRVGSLDHSLHDPG